MSHDYSHIKLSDGCKMPSVGLGLWKIEQANTAEMVIEALKCGYRHLDAASDYGNESQTGDGIRQALEAGVCARDELWITSKLWNTYHRPDHVRPAIERTLQDLGLEHLDLYLIHFPIALQHVPIEERYPPGWIFDPSVENPRMELDNVPLAETWGAIEDLQRAGLTRYIGICNYGTALLRDLLSYAQIRPSVLQVESHPHLTQKKLLRMCHEESIAFTSFSPLGAGSYVELGMAEKGDSVLGSEFIASCAEKYSKSAAQIVLRWGVQRKAAIVPKTSQVRRLRENLDLFDFELTESEMCSIDALDCGRRYNDPGVFCEQAFGRFCPIYD